MSFRKIEITKKHIITLHILIIIIIVLEELIFHFLYKSYIPIVDPDGLLEYENLNILHYIFVILMFLGSLFFTVKNKLMFSRNLIVFEFMLLIVKIFVFRNYFFVVDGILGSITANTTLVYYDTISVFMKGLLLVALFLFIKKKELNIGHLIKLFIGSLLIIQFKVSFIIGPFFYLKGW